MSKILDEARRDRDTLAAAGHILERRHLKTLARAVTQIAVELGDHVEALEQIRREES